MTQVPRAGGRPCPGPTVQYAACRSLTKFYMRQESFTTIFTTATRARTFNGQLGPGANVPWTRLHAGQGWVQLKYEMVLGSLWCFEIKICLQIEWCWSKVRRREVRCMETVGDEPITVLAKFCDAQVMLMMTFSWLCWSHSSRSVLTLRRVARSLAPATVLLANGVSGAPAKM